MAISYMSDPPYKPSWVDRLTDYIERLPGSPWLVYLAVAVPLIAVFIAVQAWQGAYREEGFFALHIFVAVQPLYGLAAVHYLDRAAANGFHQFQSAMKGDESRLDEALFKLTTLPARQTTIAGLVGALFAVISLLRLQDAEARAAWQSVAPTPVSLAIHDVNIVIAWVGYGVWVYHALHQLRVIDWLYTSRAEIDPFHPEPLYALSGITSRTALFVLPVLYGWYLVTTGGTLSAPTSDPGFVFTVSFMLGLGLLIFIWPHWGAHRRLVEAKMRALEGNATNYKVTLQELHRMVSARKLDEIDAWHKALAMLDMERLYLVRMATWPWSPGTFRNLLIGLIIPVLVWIVQFGLQRLIE
jgi:hypothetical protein